VGDAIQPAHPLSSPLPPAFKHLKINNNNNNMDDCDLGVGNLGTT